MLGIIKKMFTVLLSSIVNAWNHTKCVSLSNQKCEIQPTFINLHPNEEFHYYPFTVKLDKCVRSWNTFNDLFNKVCVSNKTEDLNLSVFNMTTGINESKTLRNHISCKCKCKFDGTKCNSNQWWNNNKCQCEYKKYHVCEKKYVWNPSTCICENGKYLASITYDSVITCDEIIESYDDKTNFNGKRATCKMQNFYTLLSFLLITISLLIVVSIYCYLIKHRAKQKHLLPFNFINNKSKEIVY